ncbi:cytochrome P450 2C29-like isoform X2 [Phyllobates terribilis]|uniref:cytochrome P450 2C29-like isoform X2 n=1 Tax=Phyllobates terribilis TaxID=111132 RepID=UPI003CCA958F
MDLVTVLLGIIVILFLVNTFRNQKQGNDKNVPPGPKPLPIIGNIHIMDIGKPHKTFVQLAKKYGTVFSFRIGMSKSIVLCGYETIKDALINHAELFSERPNIPLFTEAIKGHGIVFATGENWKAMRRFTLSTLRDYGMGRRTIEDKITEESECLIQKLRSHEGKPFDNVTSIYAAVTNIIVSILLSKRFDYEDPTILRLMGIVNENVKLLSSPWVILYNSFPFLAKLLPGAHKTIFENVKEFENFITRTFTKHKKELDVNDQRNLIDAFLAKQQEGATVITLIHSALRDKDYFEKPEEFYPEHFLDSVGNFRKNEAFIPFSIGKRSCAGETLAKMEIFLFFTSLLQNFTFHPPPGAKLDLTPALGSTNAPQPYEICAVSRR